MHTSRRTPRDERGQVLVIVAMALVAIVAMVGLVIDGGRAWTIQRDTQNGSDAVAKAGTVVIQRMLAQVGTPTPNDFDVACAVEGSATANGVDLESAEYVDAFGDPLATPVMVGTCATDLGTAIPTGAQGVRAVASQTFETLLMKVIGRDTLRTEANAIAVVGQLQTLTGGALPITFPQTGFVCDSTNASFTIREDDGDGTWEPFEIIDEADADATNEAVVPLCSTAPGSVGFLDWGPAPGCPNQNLAESITNPCTRTIPIPAWVQTQTGNVNSLEGELNALAGSILAIPIHDGTCQSDLPDSSPPSACPQGLWSGSGDNLYYHIPFWVGFLLDEAQVQGGDAECGQPPGSPQLNPPGHGVSCLKGWFVELIPGPGSVGIGPIAPGADVPMQVTLIN